MLIRNLVKEKSVETVEQRLHPLLESPILLFLEKQLEAQTTGVDFQKRKGRDKRLGSGGDSLRRWRNPAGVSAYGVIHSGEGQPARRRTMFLPRQFPELNTELLCWKALRRAPSGPVLCLHAIYAQQQAIAERTAGAHRFQTLLFIPWHAKIQNRISLGDEADFTRDVLEGMLSKSDKEYYDKQERDYGIVLDNPQKLWRQKTMMGTPFNGNVQRFCQPASRDISDEAFMGQEATSTSVHAKRCAIAQAEKRIEDFPDKPQFARLCVLGFGGERQVAYGDDGCAGKPQRRQVLCSVFFPRPAEIDWVFSCRNCMIGAFRL